ncbi:PAS domain S-box protein [Rheinheimera sp.]|uniref:PAS domain S-box protein n=1 Tax=Rheinheimera sp. TaxID=1869214 RepID=UPI00307DFFD8
MSSEFKSSSGVPLRAFFSWPVLGLFVLFGALLILISYYNAHQAANSYASQLARQTTAQVKHQLEQLLSVPRLAAESSRQMLQSGLISSGQTELLSGFFNWQMQHYPQLTYLSVGAADGRYLGIQRNPVQGSMTLLSSWDNQQLMRSQYELDKTGKAQARLQSPALYDARQREWFQQAVRQGRTSWYPLYSYRHFKGQGIGLATPWYGNDGELQAVVAADISLDWLQQFVSELGQQVGATIFIVSEDRQLLASSQVPPPQTSVAPLLDAFAQGGPVQQQLRWQQQDYQTFFQSFQDPAGLQLSILVLVNNQQLMQQAYASQRQSGLLMMGAVLVFALLGWLLSRQLSQPVMALKEWAQQLEQGSATHLPVPESAVREVNVLSQALAQMALRLDQSFLQLEQRIEVDSLSLQRLSLAVSRTSNGVVVLNSTGQIEWVNQAFERLASLSLGQLQGRAFSQTLAEANPDGKLLQMEQALAQSKSFTLECRCQLGHSKARWLSLECDAVQNEQGEAGGFVILCQDIQSRKEAEAAAQEAQQRTERQRSALTQLVLNEAVSLGDRLAFAQVLAKTTSAAVLCNRVSVWMLSDAGDEMFCLALYQQGGPVHQDQMVLRKSDFPVYFDTIAAKGWICADYAQTDPATSEFSSVYLKPLGITSMLDGGILLAGKVVGVVCLEHIGPARQWHSDEEAFVSAVAAVMAQTLTVAQRKDAEQISKEYAQHTQTVLNNVVDGIITIDESGRIASVNPAAQQMFDSSADQLTGRYATELLSASARQQQKQAAYFPLPGQVPVLGQNRELEGQNAHGQVFAMELAVSQIRRQGRLLYICTVRDISDRKRVEKLKNEFVSTVSHELRTPLTSIAGALSLLDNGIVGSLEPQAAELVRIAHKNSQRLTSLINDLLDIEKIAAGKMQFEHKAELLLPLVHQALELNRMLAQEKQIRLEFAAGNSELRSVLDAKRFIQVLSNFLSNAIKFSPVGALVTVQLDAAGEQARISVTDRGPGIAPEFHQRLFKRFSQADSSDSRHSSGTGLGLAISKELVESMGGQIGFSSEPGQGATFWCSFPQAGASVTAD